MYVGINKFRYTIVIISFRFFKVFSWDFYFSLFEIEVFILYLIRFSKYLITFALSFRFLRFLSYIRLWIFIKYFSTFLFYPYGNKIMSLSYGNFLVWCRECRSWRSPGHRHFRVVSLGLFSATHVGLVYLTWLSLYHSERVIHRYLCHKTWRITARFI